jgi:putative effector of murein hydrolase LrgA (UPF0299 family)
MYRGYDFDHMPWFLIPVRPEVETSLRCSTKVITWILAMIVLGLLCVAFTPQSGHAKATTHQVQPQHKVQLR